MYQLTLNILLFLLIQAKITGKGRTGNGRIFIRLLSVIADCPNPDMTKERNMLSLFSSHADKQSAYRQINRFLFDFIPTGTGLSSNKITLSRFEKNLNIGRKPNWEQYRLYLAETGTFCEEILDKEKAPALVNTLLELLKQDDNINYIFYGNQFIAKDRLFGTPAHPKKICMEAFLLGLLYQTLKDFTPADAGEIELLDSESLYFHLIYLGNTENPIFWGGCEELKHLLSLEMHVSVKESLQVQPITDSFYYPLEVKYQDKIILWSPKFFDSLNQKYLFLYSSGGFGKSFLLQHQNGLFLSLSGYQTEIRKQIVPDVSSWILIQILLKYHYQYAYATYELCSACEGEEILLRQLAELSAFFKDIPENWTPKYTLLLDGLNEMNPAFQDDFAEEIGYISANWHNVRMIVSSRSVPHQEIFKKFEKLEIMGIPEDVRDELLSDYPEINQYYHLPEILKIPLFLKYFLENSGSHDTPHTRGEILDAYFENHSKNYEKPLQFVIKYALPFLAYSMNLHLAIRRSDVSDAIAQAFEVFLHDEHPYQNFIAPKGFRRQAILQAQENLDFVELLIEKTGILTVIDNQLQFSHQYVCDYFTAKYILNAVHAIKSDYSERAFDKFNLCTIWRTTSDIPYILLGEICEDYRNIPNKNGILDYHRTELDSLLDMARNFKADLLVLNILRTMVFSRNRLICGVDFSCLTLPSLIPYEIKFSNNGDYPSNFQNCKIISMPNMKTGIFCAAFSSDGKKLLFGMEDGHVILFDIKAGRILKDYPLHAYLKYPEYFQSVKFSNHDKQFIVSTEYTEFQIETESRNILHTEHKTCSLPYPVRTAAVSPDYQHFLIDDVLYSVTGERKKIQFSERYNHFRNCDFRDAAFLFNPDKNKEILRKSGAVTE